MNNAPTLLWTDIDLNKMTQREIFDTFIKDILTAKNMSGGRISNLINGKNIGKPYKILQKLARTTLDPESGAPYNFESLSPAVKSLITKWKEHLCKFPSQKETLSKNISFLFQQEFNIRLLNSDKEIIFDLSEKLKLINQDKYDLEYKLSVFSILATTWPYWDALRTGDYLGKQKDSVKKCLASIVDLIFPSSTKNPLQTDSKQRTPEQLPAEKKYMEAVSLFDKGDFVEAASHFTNIVNTYLTAPYNILAASYEYLTKCYSNSITPISPIGTKYELDNWAKFYGSKGIPAQTHQIRQKPQSSSSPDEGLCIFNKIDDSPESKQICDWIIKTKPERWSYEKIDDTEQLKDILCRYSRLYLEQIDGTVASFNKSKQKKLRFILISNNYTQNLEESLFILDVIKELQFSGNYSNDLYENIEILIRCQEEMATALLDTACSFLDSDYSPVKIYLIDERKRASDYLFAQHPLFYPLTFSFNKDRVETAETNLILVSDNPDFEYVAWLIRNAFWMLPHSSPKMTSKITLFSPYASEIAKYVASICPGLSKYTSIINPESQAREALATPVEVNIDDIAFPQLEYHPISLNSRAFQNKIKQLQPKKEVLYFVVDSTSDLASIAIGKKIRESLLQKAISSHKLKYYSSDSIVIAIRIWNPDYAGLTQDLIVPKENEHETLWFNDYKFITFGSLNDLFSWDELTGGTIELISQCIHIQYCNNNDELYDFSKTPSKQDMQSYFYRLYNRNSSFATAMSIPYRLFEAGIYATNWHISNNDAYWSETNRKLLAENFDKVVKKELQHNTGLIEKLSRYEHTRWCCYMLSMGWIPASPDEATYYMNSGVNRHSLQIAKMHPCLCSWKDLQSLYNSFHFSYNGTTNTFGKAIENKQFKNFKDDNPTYFQTIDTNNIKNTSNILRVKQISTDTATQTEII